MKLLLFLTSILLQVPHIHVLCQKVHFVKKGTGCILWTISIDYRAADDTMYNMQAAVLCCCLFDAVDRLVPCVTGE